MTPISEFSHAPAKTISYIDSLLESKRLWTRFGIPMEIIASRKCCAVLAMIGLINIFKESVKSHLP